jgi:hypothetical protein
MIALDALFPGDSNRRRPAAPKVQLGEHVKAEQERIMPTEKQKPDGRWILRHPALWGIIGYAACFTGTSVAADFLVLAGISDLSRLARYLLPLIVWLPMWLGTCQWARHH